MMKILVAYFSASGVTKGVAEKIAEKIGADIYEIKPVKPYTDADLNWMNRNSRSSVEMRDKSSRPEIITGDIDVSKYDRILLGYPVWWYTAPTIVNTFLEAYDFSGKEIIIWATSGGSGLGKAKDDLAKSTTAKILNGKILNTTAQIEQFIKEIYK
ncbi:MAG: NAD(P)H-dependent oxidoreductase [Clostridia bacterium]|nr:NAD(P)H-dependent oxidoreductase [Clostridia bacterium]